MGFVQDSHCVYENKWAAWQLNPFVVFRLASAGHKISTEDPQTHCCSRDSFLQWESLDSGATVCSHQQCSSIPGFHGVGILPWAHTSVLSPAASALSSPQRGQEDRPVLGIWPQLPGETGFQGFVNIVVLWSAFRFIVVHSLSLCASSSSSFPLLLQ